jgi:Plavaka transposase
MSASNIDRLMDLWATSLLKHNDTPIFANHSDLYNTIDSTPLGDVPWQHFSLRYVGEVPDSDVPQWMSSEYEVWFRDTRLIVQNMVSNPDFKNNFDTTPGRFFDRHGSREYQNFLSGDWAWDEAVCLYYACFPFISLTSTQG